MYMDYLMLSISFLLVCCKVIFSNHVRNISVCSTELDDDLWENMMSNGNCELYLDSSSNITSPCDQIFTPGVDYVYIPNNRLYGSQKRLRGFADDMESALLHLPLKCRDVAIRLLCYNYYLPCGYNGTYYVPQFVCSEFCIYVSQSLCSAEWRNGAIFLESRLNIIYPNEKTLKLPDCNHTDEHISYLNLSNDCCYNGNIETTYTPSSSVHLAYTPSSSVHLAYTPSSSVQPAVQLTSDNSTSIVIYFVVSVVVVLVITLLILMFIIVCLRRRKKKQTSLKADTSMIYVSDVPTVHARNKEKSSTTDTFRPRVSSTYLRQLSKNIIPGTTLQLQETLGQGEFGIVYRGLLTPDGDVINRTPIPVAIKTLKGLYSKEDVNSIMEESLKMSTFDHPNILSLIGICLDLGEAPHIVMPFMARGSLLSYLKKERPNLTISENSDDNIILDARKQLLSMCLQVAKGMSYLAQQKFVHRDLAARNCMINSSGIIKVGDFGLSEDIYLHNYFRQQKRDDSDSTAVIKLPVKWMALESLHDGLFSEKTDVWSYGVLCWEVFSLGKTPYPGLDPLSVVKLLDSGGRLICPDNAACSEEIYTLMISCWKYNPEERPRFSDLVQFVEEIMKPLAGYLDFSSAFVENTSKV